MTKTMFGLVSAASTRSKPMVAKPSKRRRRAGRMGVRQVLGPMVARALRDGKAKGRF
jgi:hypothetical protein